MDATCCRVADAEGRSLWAVLDAPYHEVLYSDWVRRDVERVRAAVADLDRWELARRVALAVLTPDAFERERQAALAALRAAQPGSGDEDDLTAEELAMIRAEIEAIQQIKVTRGLLRPWERAHAPAGGTTAGATRGD